MIKYNRDYRRAFPKRARFLVWTPVFGVLLVCGRYAEHVACSFGFVWILLWELGDVEYPFLLSKI